MFDLGAVVASSQAAVDYFLKIEGLKGEAISVVNCGKAGGTQVKSGGGDYCRLPASATGPQGLPATRKYFVPDTSIGASGGARAFSGDASVLSATKAPATKTCTGKTGPQACAPDANSPWDRSRPRGEAAGSLKETTDQEGTNVMRSKSAAAAAVLAVLLSAALGAAARAYENIEINYLLQRLSDGTVTTLGATDPAGRSPGVVKGPGRYTLKAVCKTEPCAKFTATLKASGGALTPLPGGGWALTVSDKQPPVTLTGQASFRVEGHMGVAEARGGATSYTAQECAKAGGGVVQHDGAPACRLPGGGAKGLAGNDRWRYINVRR